MTVNCPTCKKQVEWKPTSVYRPFCSKRCQMIDLGEWANENNTIAAAPAQQDLEDLSDEALEALIASSNKQPHS